MIVAMHAPDANDQWMRAIHDERLSTLSDSTPSAACAAIGARMQYELAQIHSMLEDAGLNVGSDAAEQRPMQRHAAHIDLPNAEVARRAASILAGRGFVIWEPMDRGAGEIQSRFRSVLTLARTTDVTVAVRLRWPATERRWPSSLIPNEADFSAVDLPAFAWPLYLAVRPLRLLAERAGLRRSGIPSLGPFLSTPNDLIPELLDFAQVSSADTVADLGCGDGRILIEAVRRTGCRAIGVESDAALARSAIDRAEQAGVGDRVRIITGDASTAELSQATTIFVFLPAEATVTLVAGLLRSSEAGTRIIAHEQQRLPNSPPGAESRALIAGQGVTVAHQWIAGR